MNSLNKLFLIARTHADITLDEFAAHHNISRQIVHGVLSGREKSERIKAMIIDFTNSELNKMHIRLENLRALNNGQYIGLN